MAGEVSAPEHDVEGDLGQLWRLGEQNLLDEVLDISARIQQLEVRRVALVGEVDHRVPASAMGFRTAKAWLIAATLLTPAQSGRIVNVAAALRTQPEVEAAFAEGAMPLDLAAKILTFCEKPPKKMPAAALDAARAALIEAASGPGANRAKIDSVIAVLEHMFESDAPPASEDTDRNSLHASVTLNGRMSVKGDLDAESGEMLLTALSALAKPKPEHDGTCDRRTAGQRNADAFTEILAQYLGSGVGPTEGGVKPHVNLHIRADHLTRKHSGHQCNGSEPEGAASAAGSAAAGAGVHFRGDTEFPGYEDFPPEDDDFRWNPGWDKHTELWFGSDCEPPEEIGSDEDWAAWSEELAATDDAAAEAARIPDDEPGTSPERGSGAYSARMIADGGVGWMPWMGPVSVETVRRLTCDCALSPMVLDEHGVPIDLGRTARTASARQRAALVARDRGCAFPHCGAPAAWAHAHHIEHWIDGGRTDLDNLVLLCGFHHRLIHHSDWEVAIGTDRHPEFTPPRSVDPLRQPVPANNRAGP